MRQVIGADLLLNYRTTIRLRMRPLGTSRVAEVRSLEFIRRDNDHSAPDLSHSSLPQIMEKFNQTIPDGRGVECLLSRQVVDLKLSTLFEIFALVS